MQSVRVFVVQDALHELATLKAIPQDSLPEGLAASRLAICVNCYYYCNCNSATSELNVSIFRILFQVAQAAFAVKELLEQFTEAQPTSAADTFEAKIISQSLCNSWHWERVYFG